MIHKISTDKETPMDKTSMTAQIRISKKLKQQWEAECKQMTAIKQEHYTLVRFLNEKYLDKK